MYNIENIAVFRVAGDPGVRRMVAGLKSRIMFMCMSLWDCHFPYLPLNWRKKAPELNEPPPPRQIIWSNVAFRSFSKENVSCRASDNKLFMLLFWVYNIFAVGFVSSCPICFSFVSSVLNMPFRSRVISFAWDICVACCVKTPVLWIACRVDCVDRLPCR